MFRGKKKIFITLSVVGTLLLATACNARSDTEADTAGAGTEGSADSPAPIMEGAIEIEENLPDRDIRVPDYLRGDDGESDEGENPDTEQSGEGSVHHLSGEEQTEMARQVAAQIEDSINQVLRDKDYYPNVTGISVNPECTEFNVTFSDRNLSLYENVLHMSLCIVGDRFQLYQGKQEDELMTVVNYIDASSGEIFNTINSQEIE